MFIAVSEQSLMCNNQKLQDIIIKVIKNTEKEKCSIFTNVKTDRQNNTKTGESLILEKDSSKKPKELKIAKKINQTQKCEKI